MTRPTAEIVADLRKTAGQGPHSRAAWSGLLEAADRLAVLDEILTAINERLGEDHALRPACSTCGGKQLVDPRTTEGGLDHCPDCVDGKASIEQLAATWRAVHATGKDSALIPVIGVARFATPEHHGASVMLDHLRDVRP